LEAGNQPNIAEKPTEEEGSHNELDGKLREKNRRGERGRKGSGEGNGFLGVALSRE